MRKGGIFCQQYVGQYHASLIASSLLAMCLHASLHVPFSSNNVNSGDITVFLVYASVKLLMIIAGCLVFYMSQGMLLVTKILFL